MLKWHKTLLLFLLTESERSVSYPPPRGGSAHISPLTSKHQRSGLVKRRFYQSYCSAITASHLGGCSCLSGSTSCWVCFLSPHRLSTPALLCFSYSTVPAWMPASFILGSMRVRWGNAEAVSGEGHAKLWARISYSHDWWDRNSAVGTLLAHDSPCSSLEYSSWRPATVICLILRMGCRVWPNDEAFLLQCDNTCSFPLILSV